MKACPVCGQDVSGPRTNCGPEEPGDRVGAGRDGAGGRVIPFPSPVVRPEGPEEARSGADPGEPTGAAGWPLAGLQGADEPPDERRRPWRARVRIEIEGGGSSLGAAIELVERSRGGTPSSGEWREERR